MSILQGMKEITEYARRSEPTVLKLIREEGFPAVKEAGEWISTTDLIEEWRVKRIDAACLAESA